MIENYIKTNEQELEIIFNRVFDIFNKNATPIFYSQCQNCIYYTNFEDHKDCLINKILISSGVLERTNICYYHSIASLVEKYYPEFEEIVVDVCLQYLGKFQQDITIKWLQEDLKNYLFEYIDDVYCFRDNMYMIDVMFKFKPEIISFLIGKVYKDVLKKRKQELLTKIEEKE